MLAVVTGAAGFIGSTLSDQLLADGWVVRGVDNFAPFYPESAKRDNLIRAVSAKNFSLIPADLAVDDLDPLLDGCDVVFHLAALPGAQGSWTSSFDEYCKANIVATERTLNAASRSGASKFVYASTSSVYGHSPARAVEWDLPRPRNPYGVSKLAGETLCRMYSATLGLPTVCLRYFSVYGPRQRPDMALHRIIEAALGKGTFVVNGRGSQSRSFTYVADVAGATALAGCLELSDGATETMNIAGAESCSILDLVGHVSRIAGIDTPRVFANSLPGDPPQSSGDISRAADVLGWSPRHTIANGIERQLEWHLQRRRPRT